MDLKQLLKDAVSKAKVQGWVKDAILEGVTRHAATNKRSSFPLRPSSSTKSMRDLYYALCNYYKPGSIPIDSMDGRVHMLLDLGHAIESNLVKHIEKCDKFKVKEKNLRVSYGSIKDLRNGVDILLSGELDFIIEHDGRLIVSDSKSAGDYGFKKELIKEDHIAQINLYMHSDWARTNNVNTAWVWYYSKNDSDFRVVEFEYNAALAEATISRFQLAHDNYVQGTLPEREYVFGLDWQAKYSDYFSHDNAEFSTPFIKRSVVTLDNIFDLPEDKKELIKYIATRHGNAVLSFHNSNKRLYLTKGVTGLILKEE